MTTQSDPIEDLINDRVVAFVGEFLRPLSSDPYVVDAIMKITLRDLCHEFLVLDVSGYDIADHLEVMASVMREKAADQRSNPVAADAN